MSANQHHDELHDEFDDFDDEFNEDFEDEFEDEWESVDAASGEAAWSDPANPSLTDFDSLDDDGFE
jgi:hypothetical protein